MDTHCRLEPITLWNIHKTRHTEEWWIRTAGWNRLHSETYIKHIIQRSGGYTLQAGTDYTLKHTQNTLYRGVVDTPCRLEPITLWNIHKTHHTEEWWICTVGWNRLHSETYIKHIIQRSGGYALQDGTDYTLKHKTHHTEEWWIRTAGWNRLHSETYIKHIVQRSGGYALQDGTDYTLKHKTHHTEEWWIRTVGWNRLLWNIHKTHHTEEWWIRTAGWNRLHSETYIEHIVQRSGGYALQDGTDYTLKHKTHLMYTSNVWRQLFMAVRLNTKCTTNVSDGVLSFCSLMTPGRLVPCMTILFYMLAYHQIRHQDTCNVGCQPGDCRWSVNLPQGLCGYVWVNKFTLSPSRVVSEGLIGKETECRPWLGEKQTNSGLTEHHCTTTSIAYDNYNDDFTKC